MQIFFKEFLEHARKEKNLSGFRYPVHCCGLILGIIGLVLGNSHQKETQLDYKTEKILNIVGIVISIINWIAGILLTMNGFM